MIKRMVTKQELGRGAIEVEGMLLEVAVEYLLGASFLRHDPGDSLTIGRVLGEHGELRKSGEVVLIAKVVVPSEGDL